MGGERWTGLEPEQGANRRGEESGKSSPSPEWGSRSYPWNFLNFTCKCACTFWCFLTSFWVRKDNLTPVFFLLGNDLPGLIAPRFDASAVYMHVCLLFVLRIAPTVIILAVLGGLYGTAILSMFFFIILPRLIANQTIFMKPLRPQRRLRSFTPRPFRQQLPRRFNAMRYTPSYVSPRIPGAPQFINPVWFCFRSPKNFCKIPKSLHPHQALLLIH